MLCGPSRIRGRTGPAEPVGIVGIASNNLHYVIGFDLALCSLLQHAARLQIKDIS
jgi:hypothetical protein